MPETASLKIGDVVTLKSGSPKMTICEIISAASARCIWFSDGKLSNEIFVPETLYLEQT